MNLLTPQKPFQSPCPYKSMLEESINRFLAEYRNGVTDFSDFLSIFSRLLHSLPDPPLQFTWFYSAVAFHSAKLACLREPSKRASVAKDLFHSLLSFSEYCFPAKKIAILAPVVYEFYYTVIEEKGLKREVESLLEGLLSYCSICCVKELYEDDGGLEGLGLNVIDLLPVWMVNKCVSGDYLKDFFPMSSDQFREKIKMGCWNGLLAGVVVCQAFLLRLCLKFQSGMTRVEQEKILQSLAADMISDLPSFYFLEAILHLLLEPVLPVASLLSSENEVLLREVLYDTVMMMEHPFINPQIGVPLLTNHLKSLALAWLFVADSAIQSAREKGDQGKTNSYISAFSGSSIPLKLIDWVCNQTGINGKISRPNISSPVALIKWLLALKDQGVTVFDGDAAKLLAKAQFCTSRVEHVLPIGEHFWNNLDNKLPCNFGNGGRAGNRFGGDAKTADPMEAAIVTGNGRMNVSSTDGIRKRKEGANDESCLQVKFVKFQFHENSARDKLKFLGNGDAWSIRSKVNSSVYNEDIEVMEQ